MGFITAQLGVYHYTHVHNNNHIIIQYYQKHVKCLLVTIGNVYAAWFWMHLLAACVAVGVVNGLGWIRYLDDPCYQ